MGHERQQERNPEVQWSVKSMEIIDRRVSDPVIGIPNQSPTNFMAEKKRDARKSRYHSPSVGAASAQTSRSLGPLPPI